MKNGVTPRARDTFEYLAFIQKAQNNYKIQRNVKTHHSWQVLRRDSKKVSFFSLSMIEMQSLSHHHPNMMILLMIGMSMMAMMKRTGLFTGNVR